MKADIKGTKVEFSPDLSFAFVRSPAQKGGAPKASLWCSRSGKRFRPWRGSSRKHLFPARETDVSGRITREDLEVENVLEHASHVFFVSDNLSSPDVYDLQLFAFYGPVVENATIKEVRIDVFKALSQSREYREDEGDSGASSSIPSITKEDSVGSSITMRRWSGAASFKNFLVLPEGREVLAVGCSFFRPLITIFGNANRPRWIVITSRSHVIRPEMVLSNYSPSR